MSYLMGIDIGTSSIKCILIDASGKLVSQHSEEYGIDIPLERFAEQDPQAWWRAAIIVIQSTIRQSRIPPSEIKCIGFSGQMHGMVLLDREGRVLRPAIIHCDQRSHRQIEELYGKITEEEMGDITSISYIQGFNLPL